MSIVKHRGIQHVRTANISAYHSISHQPINRSSTCAGTSNGRAIVDTKTIKLEAYRSPIIDD